MSIKPQYLSNTIITKLRKTCAIISILSLILSLILIKLDPSYSFASYLTSFTYFISLSLGAFFLVIIFNLTRAGWSVALRRLAEFLMNNYLLFLILFIPLLFGIHSLYHWSHADAVLHDHLLQVKQPYLNTPFFILRSIIYFSVWIWLSKQFFNRSTQQDVSANVQLTADSQRQSTYAILLYALTITFASIDWIMTLTPHWYSTMFGVYFFAGSVASALSALSLFAIILRRNGYLTSFISIEHFHDLGKLIYGFVIFWAYTGFSQYFLIWYANIPEETEFYIARSVGSWADLSLFLAIGHFAIPFFLFMSKHMKRNLKVHSAIVLWILFMHFVDIFWMIMPTFRKTGFSLTLLDLSFFVFMGSLVIGYLASQFKNISLIAYNDPRIKESINFENV